MAFLVKTPSLPSTQASGQEQISSYREADPVPIGYGCQPYGSHWLSQQYDWVQVPAGQQGKWNYYSIAAAYRISTDTDLYIGKAILDENEPYDLDYTFAPGEQSHVFTLNGALAGGFAMTVEVFRGSDTQTFSAALRAGTGQNHPPYRRTITAIWRNVVAGINQTAARQLALEIGVAAPAVGAFTPDAFSPRYGVNLVAAIYGLCRERKGGLGVADGVLDETHWGDQAIALQTVGIGQRQGDQTYAHPVFAASAQDAAQAISAALAYVDGFVYFEGGQLRFGWFPHQSAPPTGLPTITEHDLEAKPSGAGFGDWNVGATSTVVLFKDKDRRYTDTAAKYNAPVNSTTAKVAQRVRKDRPMIHAVEQARVIAAEESADGSADDSGVNLTVFKSRAVTTGGAPLMPGDLVTWSYAPQSIALPCRVTERRLRFGAASDTLTVIRERGAFPKPFVAEPDPRVPQPDDAPGNVVAADVRLWLLPSGFGTDVNRLAVLIARSKLSITGATISFSTAGSAPWSDIHAQKTFAAKCTVATTINSSAGTIRVTSTSVDLARMNAQDAVAQANDLLLLVVDGEAMSVGAKTVVSTSTYDLGILRARQGSTAAGHASAAVAWLVYRSDLEPIEHLEFERIASGGAYNATVATKYFKIALATKDAIGAAKPDDPGLSITLPNTTPAGVDDLTATKGTGRTVELKWTKKTGTDETRVWRNTANDFSSATEVVQTKESHYVDVTSAALTLYYYWVTGENVGDLRSGASNVASVTTGAAVGDLVVPSAPSAPTLVSSDTKIADDGTGTGIFIIGVPSLPAGASFLHIRYQTDGKPGWIVADVWDSGRTDSPRRTAIDDLPLGKVIKVDAIAYSLDGVPSAATAATGSPFTAPDPGAPAAPTGLAMSVTANDLAGAQPKYGPTGAKMKCVKATWTKPASKNVAYYELNTEAFVGTPSAYDDQNIRTKGTETFAFIFVMYAGGPPSATTKVRAISTVKTATYPDGIPSAWTSAVDSTPTAAYGTKDMAEQSSTAIATTGGSTLNLTGWSFVSARRLKKNIRALSGRAALTELARWRSVIFDWRTKDVRGDVGWIADEIAEVRPSAVYRDQEGKVLSLDYTKPVPLLVAAVMLLARQIAGLTTEVRALRQAVKKLERSHGRRPHD